MPILHRSIVIWCLTFSSALSCIQGLSVESTSSRRSFVASLAALTGMSTAFAANADDSPIDVYFGVGCFWHIQHEFVEAEKSFLGRTTNVNNPSQRITSLTGYAGGKRTGDQGRVCYHNLLRVADYGSLGHGEVVGMSIPQDKLLDFTKYYFTLFDQRTKGEYVLGQI
jgi:hypothetical protein